MSRILLMSATVLALATALPAAADSADITMTHQVQEAAQVLGITLHDHLIIGRSRELSFRAQGYL